MKSNLAKYNISICMSTFNGARFLSQQIDSLLSQTYQDWQLLIRDDCSTDNTVEIINSYVSKYPDKINLITDNLSRLGPTLSFGKLLEMADSDYFMFCDQDDIWMPDKIELTFKTMREFESRNNRIPLLVHSDLKVVDSNLNIVAESMWAYQKLFTNIGDDLNKIIIKNIVSGCTMMINRRAKETSIPIPHEAVIHDWWIAINVARNGEIISIPNQLTYYRQHENNKIGAYRENLPQLLNKLKKSPKSINAHYKMVKKFDPAICYSLILFRKLLIKFMQLVKIN